MFHVGLDIHSNRITICALDARGQVVRRAQVRAIEEMLTTLKALPDRFEVCHEASCGYGHYHDRLRVETGKPVASYTARDLVFALSRPPAKSKAAGRAMSLPHLRTDRNGILNTMADEAIPVEVRFPKPVSS